jgi:hypothetical protein
VILFVYLWRVQSALRTFRAQFPIIDEKCLEVVNGFLGRKTTFLNIMGFNKSDRIETDILEQRQQIINVSQWTVNTHRPWSCKGLSLP